jgi:Dolichyl-phosphate-mannose-protein mannosyltransferase
MSEIAVRSLWSARVRASDISLRWFWIGVAGVSAALATVLAIFLSAWPPHEDEALAIFTGRKSLPDALDTVIAQRGGAPLHFLFAWLVVHLGGGLMALRSLSLVFAVASVPAIAVLGAQLADRITGLVAATLASGTWVLLFHGIFGRMYSLFLLTSALSFIALLRALDRPSRRAYILWAVALLATLATHPYAVLVLGAQAAYVILRGDHRRASFVTLAAVVVAATPFWFADFVLRDRFGVGVGGGGARLGSPHAVAHYFWWVSGDFSAGHHEWSVPVLLTAVAGLIVLALRRRTNALLIACVIFVPALAFMLAKLHSTASPEARHLIFALPFFSTMLAAAIVALGRVRPIVTAPLAIAAIVVLLVGEVRWAHAKTPQLFDGDPASEVQARHDASTWLAAGARRDDVLLGYEPLFLSAWEKNRSFSAHALPRADPKLLLSGLRAITEPLGRGTWVFDASDTTNVWERQTIRYALPKPASEFDGRAFGPYLVLRTRKPLLTRAAFLATSERVEELGRELKIGDADVNLQTVVIASERLYKDSRSSSRSRSTISR